MELRVRGQLDDARRLVRQRLRAGWEVWVTTAGTQWARLRRREGKNDLLETSPITPPEGVVLDEVLLEESRR